MCRIKFNGSENLGKFFEEVKCNMFYKTWKDIAIFLNTTRAMLGNYRNGKVLLSENRFEKLLSLLPEERNEFFFNQVVKLPSNWGQVVGGLNAYKKNKIFFEHRSNKQIFSNKKLKYDFDINMPLSKELCEFVGVIIGDGCTNKYGRAYQTNISGDKLLDLDYYQTKILPICKNLFNMDLKILFRDSGIYINLYSKKVFNILTERFNIPKGVKCYTITIPKEILDSSKELIAATLRGMFNTDGGIGIDKRKTYKKPYIRINYTSASPTLINQISSILNSYSIMHSIHITNKLNEHTCQQIQINGEKNVKIFMNNIGLSNLRHTKKLEYLKWWA